jgi:hypothetical protein
MKSRAIELFGKKENQPEPPLVDAVDKMNPKFQGKKILLEVTVGYPGSRISDIAIGDNIYKIQNSDLVKSRI